MREKITLQSVTITKDQYHENTETWTDSAHVYANIRPASAREQLLIANRLESQQALFVTMRYRPGVTVKNRIKHVHCGNTRYYDIDTIADRKFRGRVLDIVALYEQDNLV